MASTQWNIVPFDRTRIVTCFIVYDLSTIPGTVGLLHLPRKEIHSSLKFGAICQNENTKDAFPGKHLLTVI